MDDEDVEKKPKWEATISRRTNASGDQIWPFMRDFFGIYKWFPSLSISYGIHGENGEVDSIRYCEGSSIPPQTIIITDTTSTTATATNNNNTNKNTFNKIVKSWSKEKLTEIDSAKKSLSYEIVDSNVGFNSYAATMKVIDSGNEKGNGCVVAWSFTVDPVAGFQFEDLVKKYELGLESMVGKMEREVFEKN